MFLSLALILAADPSLPVPKFAAGYAAAHARVTRGESLVVYAGVPLPTRCEANAVRVDAIPGTPAGVYLLTREGGKVMLAAKEPKPKPVAVATVKGHSHRCPVDGTVWSHRDNDPTASHNCPTCGRQVLEKHEPAVAIPLVASGRPKRVVIGGRYYDQYPDGTLRECVECNRGR
jgi:hypothetical protein